MPKSKSKSKEKEEVVDISKTVEEYKSTHDEINVFKKKLATLKTAIIKAKAKDIKGLKISYSSTIKVTTE